MPADSIPRKGKKMTAKTSATKATPKAKTPAKAEIVTDAGLVSAFISIATTRNASSWDFFHLCANSSMRTIRDSIKQGQKECGLALPDLTPTKAQYFPTLALLEKKFKVSQTMPFAKAISLAVKAEVAFKAEGARSAIKSAKTAEELALSIPKQTRKARPASEKGSATFEGEEVELDLNTFEELMEAIKVQAIEATSEDREEWAKGLTSLAKLIRAMNTSEVSA